MDEKQRKQILEQLDQLLYEAGYDIELFDRIAKVRKAIKNWDLQGPIPHESELREWGLLLTEAEALQIIRLVVEKARENPEDEQLDQVRKDLMGWFKDGYHKPLPHRKFLVDLGLWPLRQSAGSQAPNSSQDHQFKVKLESIKTLMKASPHQAIKELEALRVAEAGHQEEIDVLLTQARTFLSERTEELIKDAEREAQQNPDNIEVQKEAWQRVLDVNPDSAVARKALNDLLWHHKKKQLEQDLASIQAAAQKAYEKQNLVDFMNQLNKVELQLAEALPEDIKSKFERLRQELETQRDALRQRLGVVSTKTAEREYRDAYILVYESIEQGIPFLIDEKGVMGKPGAEVPTAELAKRVGEKFITTITEKVQDRLNRAREERERNPNLALQHLEQARVWLEDQCLTQDHKRSLEPLLDKVLQEIQETERWQKNYEDARAKVLYSGQVGLEPEERIASLNEARQLFPNYPDWERHYEEVQTLLAAKLAGEVEKTIVEAQREVKLDNYQGARDLLYTIRFRVYRDIPEPKPDSALAKALAKLDNVLKSVTEAEQDFERLKRIVVEVDARIDRYREGHQQVELIHEARGLLEQVPEALQQHFLVSKVRARLAAIAGDPENAEAGRRAYEQRQWASAKEYLEKVGPTYPGYQEIERLLKRASAMVAIQQAQAAEGRFSFNEALQQYERACVWFAEAGTDGGFERDAEFCQQRKTELEKSQEELIRPLEEAKRLLNQATEQSAHVQTLSLTFRLRPIPNFQRAYNLLKPIVNTPSLLSQDISLTYHNVCEEWKKAYWLSIQQVLDNEDCSLEVVEEAYERAKELKEAGLLASKSEEQLFYRLWARLSDERCKALLRNLGERWVDMSCHELRQHSIEWDEVEANRRERLRIPLMMSEDERQAIQKQLQKAMDVIIDICLDEHLAQGGVSAAREYLSQRWRSGTLPSSFDWFRRWIHLCWEDSAWEEARQVAKYIGDLEVAPKNRQSQVQFWLDLTDIVKTYDEEQIDEAQKRIEALIINITRSDEKSRVSILQEEEQYLKRLAAGRIFEKAQKLRRNLRFGVQPGSEVSAARQNLDPANALELARLYSLVLKIDEDHVSARAGLQELGNSLRPMVDVRLEEARNLRASGDLERTRRRASELLRDLELFLRFSQQLKLSQDQEKNLKETLEDLKEKKDVWDQASMLFREFDQKLAEALANPEPFPEGGWDFSEVEDILAKMRQDLQRRERDLANAIVEKSRELDLVRSLTGALAGLIKELLDAIQKEDFDRVINVAHELDKKWREGQLAYPDLQGLERLIRFRYTLAEEEVRTLDDHKRMAERQKQNLARWEAYTNKVKELLRRMKELEKNLLKELDELKQDFPLEEILRQCGSWKNEYECFLRLQAPERPLSLKARHQESEANYEARLQIAKDNRTKIEQLERQAQEDLEKFKRRYLDLKKWYDALPSSIKVKEGKREPTRGQKNAGTNLYRECCALDPLNRELSDMRKNLEKAKILD